MKKIIEIIMLLALGFSGCSSLETKMKPNNINMNVWKQKENITRFYTKSKEDKGEEFYLLSDGIEDLIAGIEVELIKKSGKAKEGYGIIFEFQDEENYCELLITVEGKYKWIEMIEGEEFFYEGWKNSKLLNKGYNVYNKIGIIYNEENKEFSIFINGIRQETFELESIRGGKSAMFVSVSQYEKFSKKPVEVIFKNNGKLSSSQLKPKMKSWESEDKLMQVNYDVNTWNTLENDDKGETWIYLTHVSNYLSSYLEIYTFDEYMGEEQIERYKNKYIKGIKKNKKVFGVKEEKVKINDKEFIKIKYYKTDKGTTFLNTALITGKDKKIILLEIDGVYGTYEEDKKWNKDCEELINNIEFEVKKKIKNVSTEHMILLA